MPAKVPVLLAIPLPPKFLLPRSFITASKVASKQQCRNFGIRSIQRPNPSRFDRGPGLKGKLSSQKAALRRRIDADTLPHRTGALAIKRGMTSVFDPETGVRTPCTVLQLDGAQVVAHKTKKQHGYNAVCVGCGSKAVKNTTLPMLGHYSAQGVAPKKHLHEFRVLDHKGLLPVGEVIHADWFIPGQYVDARADCKGKGFQGVMKRWGMHGQDRSHGVSLAHRSLGSAGQGQGGGSRVYPGKKMAGNMGGQQVTQQNLRVVEVRREEGIVVVAGAVSGPKLGIVQIQDALKKPWPDVPPPTKPEEIAEEEREAVSVSAKDVKSPIVYRKNRISGLVRQFRLATQEPQTTIRAAQHVAA